MESLHRLAATLLVSLTACVIGGDWPTYRYDARRSACSPDALPAELKTDWTFKLPTFSPAFPNEARQQFDESYEPVCAADTLVIASPVDGSVRAFSVVTGKGLWRHYTEGPVRLAPVIHQGKVLFGSDDGTFCCLNLKDGTLIWQIRACEANRPDMLLLGNNRLISQWPVRGGAVVVDNIVYFGSGIWPTMGVTVYALDVANGTPAWQNAGLSFMDHVRIDHNTLFDAGISPQGYMSATEDTLIIANGRSQPLALNRNDGSLFHFVQGYRRGDCRIVLGGDYAFVGNAGVVSLVDFREIGSKWLQAGDSAPNTFQGGKIDQFEGPIHGYKMFPGCDADSVFDGDTAYGLANGILYAYDLSKAVLSEWETKQGSKVVKPFRWDVPMTLRVPIGKGNATKLFLKAGDCLYGRAGNLGIGIRLTDTNPPAKVFWEHDFGSMPASMISAGNRLFVTLQNGVIQCLSTGGGASEAPAPPTPPAPETPSDLQSLLQVAESTQGICLVIGTMDPGEVVSFQKASKLRLIVLSPDADNVKSLRDTFGRTDQYGTRFEVIFGTPLHVILPQYLASVLWLRAETLPSEEILKRLWPSIHPYGGMLCYTGSEEDVSNLQTIATAIKLPGAAPQSPGKGIAVLERPGPLAGAWNWTHETADAARSHFSKDEIVRGPLGPLWYGDGPDYGFIKNKDYGRGVKPQVVDGRVFALQQFSRTLIAYDAYTGRLLWQQQGTGEKKGYITRFVSRPEGIYAAGKGQCVVYEPATGEPLRTIPYAQEMEKKNSSARASGIVVTDSTLLIAAADEDTGAIEKGLWDADVLICMDRETGNVRWKRRAQERFNIKALAIGQGMIFCTDSMSPLANEKWQRRGKGISECTSRVMALDERTGELRWQHEHKTPYRQHGPGGWLTVRGQDDWLVYAEAEKCVLAGSAQKALLFEAADGSPVWEKDLNLRQPIIVMGKKILDQSSRLIDLRTAEILKSGLFARGGCNYAVANKNLAFLREHTVCYIDLESGERQRLRNMRSGCSNSTIPACGLLNIPNFSRGCICNYPVQTSSAWIYMPGIDDWGGSKPTTVTPLKEGPQLPVVDLEVAKEMHEFKRSYLVKDPETAQQHLLGRWTFDTLAEGKSDSIPDASGRGSDCKLQNPVFEDTPNGRALKCNADTSSTLGRAALVDGPIRNAVTLCAWVKLGDKQHKGATGVVECPQYYRLMVDNTDAPYTISLTVQTDSRSWRSGRTPKTIPSGEWHHIAGTYDGEVGETVMYLDGKEVGRSTGMPAQIAGSSKTIDIGVRDGGAYLSGSIDDVRVYDRVLDANVIKNIAAERP